MTNQFFTRDDIKQVLYNCGLPSGNEFSLIMAEFSNNKITPLLSELDVLKKENVSLKQTILDLQDLVNTALNWMKSDGLQSDIEKRYLEKAKKVLGN